MNFIAEIILALFITGSAAMRYFGVAGAEFLLPFSLILTAFFYFYFAPVFAVERTQSSVQISRWSGYIYAIALIGILFKIQVFFAADWILAIGLIGCILGILPYLIYMMWKEREETTISPVYKRNLVRTIVIGVIASFFFHFPTKNIISIYHPQDEQYVDLFMKQYKHPDSIQYRLEFYNYRDSIEFSRKNKIKK